MLAAGGRRTVRIPWWLPNETVRPMDARLPSLTFVVIVHNGAGMITPSLTSVSDAIQRSAWPDAKILVVDDGSTDGTAAEADAFARATPVPVRVLRQANAGRLAASRAGVEQADTDLVSFIGVRMRMHPDSLVNLAGEMASHPERRVWNCHIEVPRDDNVQAQFWHVMTFIGWRRYLRDPRLVSFGQEDFDYYPKGSGGFICPREVLLDGYDSLTSLYDDPRYSSDDTALIRYVAGRERIWMTPRYSADYLARADMGGFARHTLDRGTLFLDSYLHRGTRLFWPLVAFLVGAPLAAAAVVRRPRLLLGLPVVSAAAAGGLAGLGVPRRDIRGFSLLAPAFGLLFTAGLWRGLLLLLRTTLRRGRSRP